MSSLRSKLIRKLFLKKMAMASDPFIYTIDQLRQNALKANSLIKLPKGSIISDLRIGEVKAEWLRAETVDCTSDKVLLYFHSGGFCLPYTNAHRALALRLSSESNIKVLAVDYRLAPEHPYPAAIEDCLAVYRWLLDQNVDPENIIVGGDSAGAGLALSTLLSLKESKEPLPKAALLLSLFGGEIERYNGESYKSRKEKDPLNSIEIIKKYISYYIGNQSVLSPIDRDLSGLPPLFIQVGDHELLLSDSIALSERAKASGVKVTLDVWEDMWHVFQGFAMIMPEAKKAVANVSEFIADNTRTYNKPLKNDAATLAS